MLSTPRNDAGSSSGPQIYALVFGLLRTKQAENPNTLKMKKWYAEFCAAALHMLRTPYRGCYIMTFGVYV